MHLRLIVAFLIAQAKECRSRARSSSLKLFMLSSLEIDYVYRTFINCSGCEDRRLNSFKKFLGDKKTKKKRSDFRSLADSQN